MDNIFGTTCPLKRIALMLAVLSLGLGGISQSVMAAEACYQDSSGRIVKRRLPGFKRITCPGEEVVDSEIVDVESEVDDPSEPEYQSRRQARETSDEDQRTRNTVSVVPRPRLEDYAERVPVPDRWRIVDSLGYAQNLWDPYNRNVLKADKPVTGDWFFNLGVISDTVYEIRDIPTPVGPTSTNKPGSLDAFGSDDQWLVNQNLALEFLYYQGDTVFRPPDYEFRFTPVINYNYVELDEILGINANPARGRTRKDQFIGIQALFIDKHLRDVSERYDFDSIRVGIQPFSSDFRGFLFQDNQLGIRLFGNRNNNIFLYNLAWFRRLEKDTNSGLNDLGKAIRDDDVFLANLYWQDMPVKGFVSLATVVYNRSRDDGFFFDKNNFIARPASIGKERPRNYDVVYLGYSGDGHFGRLNLTTSIYAALGEEDGSVFTDRKSDIEAWFAAAEVSIDFDWIRPRVSFLFGSGDDDPFDDKSQGFDAIFENPQFAGSDTSYWIRQPVPFIGGGRVTLSNRNAVLNSLRSSKEQGQSNFTNPGILLMGAGVDMDILPELRLSVNYNYLRFHKTEVLEIARNQGNIGKEIGHDISIAATYRPFTTQNIVIRASYARLIPGNGFEVLFPDEDSGYFLLNVLLAF